MASHAGPSHQGDNTQRILCPINSCPDSLPTSTSFYRDFPSIRNHLNGHCSGHLPGAVPYDFLHQYNFSLCNVCNKVLHKKFKTCPKCKPTAHRQSQINSMRARNILNNTNASNQPLSNNQITYDLPSLSEIHRHFVPTIRNVPLSLRNRWTLCLSRALAKATWENSIKAWTELQMLAKSTLCRAPRAGKSHLSQRLAWTRKRLNRWLSGERPELWHDLPKYQQPGKKSHSKEATKKSSQDRCLSLASEGGFSQACNALVSSPPLLQTAETTARLKEKHPPARQPVDLSALGMSNTSLVPLSEVDSVERSIRSFHRLSGGGPSGLRPLHIKNCLSTEHRDEL